MMRKVLRDGTGLLMPGQDLAVAGYIGQHGTQAILRERWEELRRWFTESYLEELCPAAAGAVGGEGPDLRESGNAVYPEYLEIQGVTECEHVEKGGILAALWRISGAYGMGVEIDLRSIPIRQGTIEICERYELNPYRLWSGDCCLLAADHGEALVRSLRKRGIPAAVVGRVRADQQKKLLYGDHEGCLDRPSPDELWKVLEDRSTTSTVYHKSLCK